MKHPHLPKTDSIKKLASFWDAHDLTDFEKDLEEVTESVFVPPTTLQLRLEADAADKLRGLAKARGLSGEELVRHWVLEKLSTGRPSTKQSVES